MLDEETPVSLFRKLNDEKKPLFLLESVEGEVRFSRYSFLGVDTFGSLQARGKRVFLPSFLGESRNQNPFALLKKVLHRAGPPILELPPFYGGLVGYIGYEAARYIERLPVPDKNALGMPEIFLHITRTLLIFDHYRHTLSIVVNTFPKGNIQKAYDEGNRRVARELRRITSCQAKKMRITTKGRKPSKVSSNFSPRSFKQTVEQARRYIVEGECIQVVPSQRFSLTAPYEDIEIYRGLRHINPSPYLFLLRTPTGTLIGSSPELLVRVQKGVVTVRPIAGTRPRAIDEEEDKRLEDELRNDPKERAEHVMLVDLGRNDVGRVAVEGTVKVEEFMTVERYSHVMHLVSEVSGQLSAKQDAVDAFCATFPAGTVTGAPKIRAQEIIAELEPSQRGPYAGAAGFFSWTGESETAIIIRTILKQGQKLTVQAGAGIVYDSVPQKELEETRNKAKGMLAAIDLVQKGFQV